MLIYSLGISEWQIIVRYIGLTLTFLRLPGRFRTLALFTPLDCRSSGVVTP